MNRKRILVKSIFLVMLILSGCDKDDVISSPTTVTKETPIRSTPTLQATPNMTPVVTNTLIPFTSTLTITPTFSYLYPIQTQTHIITPLPTLSEIQSREYFVSLLNDNARCKLPCFLGITPGISTWDETRNMLIYLGLKLVDYAIPTEGIYHGSGIDLTTPFIQTTLGYYEVNDVIQAINISSIGYEDKQYFRRMWNYFSPDILMSTYGTPSEIYINAGIGHGEVGGPGSSLILKYNRFLVIYTIKPIEVIQDNITMYQICPSWQDNAWYPKIDIYIISNDVFPSIYEYISLISSKDLKSYKSIEEVASITTDDYYKNYLRGNVPACLDTPQEIWK